MPSVPGQEKGPGFECNAGWKTRRAVVIFVPGYSVEAGRLESLSACVCHVATGRPLSSGDTLELGGGDVLPSRATSADSFMETQPPPPCGRGRQRNPPLHRTLHIVAKKCWCPAPVFISSQPPTWFKCKSHHRSYAAWTLSGDVPARLVDDFFRHPRVRGRT